MDYKLFLDKGFSISKGSYLIAKNDGFRRYHRNHYCLKHLSMGGWNELGSNENWDEFVEYLTKKTGTIFEGINKKQEEKCIF